MDPSLITDWTTYGFGGDPITQVTSIWNELEVNGNLSATWKKLESDQGVIIPRSLSGTKEVKAILNADIIPLWDTGTLFNEVTTGAETFPDTTKAYYVKSITVNAVEISQLLDINLTWNIPEVYDEQFEPNGIYYERRQVTGTATVKDLSALNLSELQEGIAYTVVATFEDAAGGPDLTVDLQSCFVTATIEGNTGTLTFEQVDQD